ARQEIPADLIPLYQQAASTCRGLDWTILAAIHKIETGFGRGAIASDKGAWGPMQFMPKTWRSYGVDGDEDGIADVNDVNDAVFGAAHLLCLDGAGDPSKLPQAIWDYNHSDAYVAQVLTLAGSYEVATLHEGFGAGTATDILNNPRIALSRSARADVLAGAVDRRVLGLLAAISTKYSIGVSVIKTGHSKYVEGTNRVSNHYYGRAADISIVDGEPVSSKNEDALSLVLALGTLRGVLRPDEVGDPFSDIRFPGNFSDAAHQDHIHVGFNE
ncbi:MAG: lytic transglycosylase domain-containing protein, partial [Actinomycetota bacterium]|nr:lytic transglycosylase domain-containing protein [Actinomycetota bacterium]